MSKYAGFRPDMSDPARMFGGVIIAAIVIVLIVVAVAVVLTVP